MTNLITPPPELVQQWWAEEDYDPFGVAVSKLATRAAQWGADQELEACCECMPQWYRAQSFLKLDGDDPVPLLRAARRPNPPSLKEQALTYFESFAATFETSDGDSDLIRRALEQLPEPESSND